MSDQIHVLASFRSQEDLLAAMRRSISWIKLSEGAALASLAARDAQAVKVLLSPDEYSEREVELAVEVWEAYVAAIAKKRTAADVVTS